MVDLCRRTYRTQARLFSDSDETVTLRWYRCQPGAQPLPYPTAIHLSVWDFQPWARRGVGEVYDAPRPAAPPTAPPSALGQQPCTPDPRWFSSGEPYRPDLPPAPRDAWGLLACCNTMPGRFPAALLIGGSSVAGTNPSRPGGLSVGGRSVAGLVELPAGGTSVGGSSVAGCGELPAGGTSVGGSSVAGTVPPPCDTYSVSWDDDEFEMELFAPNVWVFGSWTLTKDGPLSWTLNYSTEAYIWQTTDWDGHGCTVFAATGSQDDATVCCFD